ncbi:MAG TPA: glycoside hydrolase family 3 N-terminal domain-containing protein [Nocardioides sp.]|uniref:glycoside hydrolase family 3 N-terminal domain-containing protein n=1 Tax=Nocardioides sp. TaxID=35761 RepID=UPI002E36115C|nr:glycoside hydrolase family 3 N-terminal domain-containing protein [Nocardioides sp.]HEX5090771.1 glycoside hydrolase family 3 N-terminal domain-containing protein [Nocardioides sp.]
MTLESTALRVLLPSFAGTRLPAEVEPLLEEGLGGLCLFGSNTADGPDALAAYTAAVRSVSPGAVIAIDEEGGDVTRLHVTDGSPVLGPLALGEADDLALTRSVGRAIGLELAAVGINLDLGPVADVNSNPDNPVIGTRSFGSSAPAVAAHVAAWTIGLQSAGVAACAKHFPGHGDTGEDSHLALPALDAGLATLAERELVPFAAAVEAGTAAVMTSHIVVRAFDPELPATLSAPVVGLLRGRLGFRGVVVSDALDMAGASATRGIPEAAVLAVAAGADLLCIGADNSVEQVRELQCALVEAVRSGRLSEERLDDAAKAVSALAVTSVHEELDSRAFSEALAAGAARAVTVAGALPSLAGARVVRVDSRPNIAVGQTSWGLPADHVLAPGTTDLPPGPLVLQVRDAHRQPDVLATLAGAPAGSVVVEWGWPADRRTDDLPTIHARGWSRPGAVAVADVLRKAGLNQ